MKMNYPLRALALTALVLAVLPVRSQAAMLMIDQQNTASDGILGNPGITGGGFGQSFTPQSSFFNAATFQLRGVSTGYTMRVDLFAGVGTGRTLLASSGSVLLTNTTLQTVEFDFPSTQTLVPNSVYTLRIVAVSSGTTSYVAYNDADSYAGGTYYSPTNTANPNYDLTFAEGTNFAVAPEPSTWAAVVLGAGLLGVVALRRHRVA